MCGFNSEHSYVETDSRKQANKNKQTDKNKLKEALLLCCILVLERTNSSVLRNLHFHRKPGLCDSFIQVVYTQLSENPAQPSSVFKV